MLTGWLLADELTSRALAARGLDRRARRALISANRARALGFGVATQLCFLVPLGAVAVMPAAVAGSTLWAHAALGPAPRAGGAAPSAPVETPHLAPGDGLGPSSRHPADPRADPGPARPAAAADRPTASAPARPAPAEDRPADPAR